MKTTWSVVVVYEDNSARERAVQFCDNLVKRFWSQGEFEVQWCSFGWLKQTSSQLTSEEKAAEADVLVFAARPEGELPVEVATWFENWLHQRGDREGALVDLVAPLTSHKSAYLMHVAHRGGMDYLTGLPQSIGQPIPDSLEYFTERAQEVGGVLEEILHQPEAQVRVRH